MTTSSGRDLPGQWTGYHLAKTRLLASRVALACFHEWPAQMQSNYQRSSLSSFVSPLPEQDVGFTIRKFADSSTLVYHSAPISIVITELVHESSDLTLCHPSTENLWKQMSHPTQPSSIYKGQLFAIIPRQLLIHCAYLLNG